MSKTFRRNTHPNADSMVRTARRSVQRIRRQRRKDTLDFYSALQGSILRDLERNRPQRERTVTA